MADNVIANPGAGGSTFATDDIGGVHYPRSKVVFGVDGVATDVSAANPMPIGVITNKAPLDLVGGGAEATALRVTLASDSTGVLSVDDNGGTLTVDGSVGVSSLVAPLNVVNGGAEATALRVTIATDSTGLLSVDDNGSSLTVDNAGTFSVQLSPSNNATYQASFSGGTIIGDTFEVLPGVGKTVQILEIYFSKPSVANLVTIHKQSTVDTGGASSNLTVFPLLSSNPGAATTVKQYTGAPTLGVLTGVCFSDNIGTEDRIDYNVGRESDQPITLLKNTTESLGIAFSAAGTINGFIKFIEV